MLIALGQLQNPVLVQTGDDADRFRQEMIGLPDHVIALLELGPCEVLRVAPATDVEHPLSLVIPFFLREARHLSRLHNLEATRRVPLRIQHAQRLEDRGAVGRPLRVLRHR